MPDIIERLRHAVVTASNDDYSEPSTEKRDRHIERLAAMQDAHAEIDRLRAKIEQIAAVCRDNAAPTCRHDMALDFVRQVAEQAP